MGLTPQVIWTAGTVLLFGAVPASAWVSLWLYRFNLPETELPNPDKAAERLKVGLAAGVVVFLIGYTILSAKFGPLAW